MRDSKESERVATVRAWPGHVSLEGMHSSVDVPHHGAGFWQQWRAFIGPAILVSVGYMDPGNWGTDLAGGAQYKYGLLWVVGLASLMAIYMQVIAARLGVSAGTVKGHVSSVLRKLSVRTRAELAAAVSGHSGI